MAKRKTANIVVEIKKLVENKKAVIGTALTMKNLKLGKVSKVYVSSNCAATVLEDIEYYSKLSKADVIKLNYSNDELGVICKKPFSISVLSVLKV